MTLEIIWSEFAETQLDEIFKFHKNKEGYKIAKELVTGIINEPN